jgi:hypothetical protein
MPASASSGTGTTITWPPCRPRSLRAIALRQAFVAIRYSQARNEIERTYVPRPVQARVSASWTASSASSIEPSIR